MPRKGRTLTRSVFPKGLETAAELRTENQLHVSYAEGIRTLGTHTPALNHGGFSRLTLLWSRGPPAAGPRGGRPPEHSARPRRGPAAAAPHLPAPHLPAREPRGPAAPPPARSLQEPPERARGPPKAEGRRRRLQGAQQPAAPAGLGTPDPPPTLPSFLIPHGYYRNIAIRGGPRLGKHLKKYLKATPLLSKGTPCVLGLARLNASQFS